MVNTIRCEHCGAETKHPVTKTIDGRPLNFCCGGCLKVYELMRDEDRNESETQTEFQAEQVSAVDRQHAGTMSSKTLTLPIVGMTCASCVAHVEGGLKKVPGVEQASVNLANERATVQFDPQQTNLDQMVAAVRRVGYDVAVDKVILL